MFIKLDDDLKIEESKNDIVVASGNKQVKMSITAAKLLHRLLEQTLYDDTESHSYMENKILKLELLIDELSEQIEYYKDAEERWRYGLK